MPSFKLTYFGIEGAAERVRLAFGLAGVPFEDERITFPEWQTMKPTTKFGQLPLLSIDGGEPIAQSVAMLNYVGLMGSSAGLYSTEPMRMLAIDEVIGLAGDFDKAWTPCLYIGMRPALFGYADGSEKTPEGQELVKKLRTTFVADKLPELMGFYAKYLKASGAFFCGDKPTIADCYILPQLRAFQKGHIDHVPVTCLDAFPEVTAWIARMMALPAVAAWYAPK